MTPTVRVYCQDEGHRRQGEDGPVRRFEVDTYELVDGRWFAAEPVYSAKRRRIAKGEEPTPPGPRLLGGDRTTQRWVGGRRDARVLFELDCTLCPQGRPVPLRDETLQRCMSLVHQSGRDEVSLLEVARVVEMMNRRPRRASAD